MESIGLSLVVAVAQNRVIGNNNALPWRLPKDLAYFKKVTMGYPIIMGRKTYESIGRPLPGRRSIVVTRQREWRCEGVDVVFSLEGAIVKAKEIAAEGGLTEVMLIGGASLYEQALQLATKLYITEVESSVEGDTVFPEYDLSQWELFSKESHKSDTSNPYGYSFAVYHRIAKELAC